MQSILFLMNKLEKIKIVNYPTRNDRQLMLN